MMTDSNFGRWPEWARTHLMVFAPAPAEDEDTLGEWAEPDPAPSTGAPRARRSRSAVLVSAAAVVVVAAIAVTLIARFATSSGGTGTPVAAPPAAPAAAASTDFCSPVDTAGLWAGNGPGGTDSARAAIAGFEHAYYVERSGAAARAFTTPDAAVPTAEEIQRGIDESVASRTAYCVQIRPSGAPDTHAVSLTVRDNTGEATFDQVITTTQTAGQVLITSIAEAK